MANFISNYLAKRAARKKVEESALSEADKIADKRMDDRGWISTTKVPMFSTYSKDPSTLTDDDKKKIQARREIRNQVIKTRLNQFDSKK